MLAYAESQLDVPVYKGEGNEGDYLQYLERFILEGHQQGGFPDYGKKYLASICADAIVQRSRLEYLCQRHPEINDQQIRSPIIIAGLPRSGTTNLANIVAADSRLNALRGWIAAYPFPSKAALDNPDLFPDKPAEQWQNFIEGLVTICPHFPRMLDVPHDAVSEETTLMHMAGTPIGFMNLAYTPGWNNWYWNEMDPQPMYDLLLRTLKALQWLHGGAERRWMLKTPHHLAFLPHLEATFDDARYIITHRDPASSVVSNAYMITYLNRATHRHPRPENGLAMAHFMTQGMVGGLVRDIDKIDPARVHHIFFHDYMADPLGECRRAYKAVGLDWTETTSGQINDYIDSHPRGRHDGKLVYDIQRDFGVSRDQVRQDYAYYLEKFPQIQIEQQHG